MSKVYVKCQYCEERLTFDHNCGKAPKDVRESTIAKIKQELKNEIKVARDFDETEELIVEHFLNHHEIKEALGQKHTGECDFWYVAFNELKKQPLQVPCKECGGSGKVKGTAPNLGRFTCPTCNGTGYVPKTRT